MYTRAKDKDKNSYSYNFKLLSNYHICYLLIVYDSKQLKIK